MATTRTNSKETKKTVKSSSKAKAPSSSKSAGKKTPIQAKAKMKARLIPKKEIMPVMTAVDPNNFIDPAHSPGHRTINLKKQFSGSTGDKVYAQDASATNQMSGANKFSRTESSQRRIISGASIEKKGRLADKE